LLILTDGKPNDLDQYEGRYGIEDTRVAIHEARQKGLTPFCVTIDEKAGDYLPHLFGSPAALWWCAMPPSCRRCCRALYVKLTCND
jgi:nitric oxide reductase NorD protein